MTLADLHGVSREGIVLRYLINQDKFEARKDGRVAVANSSLEAVAKLRGLIDEG